MFVLAVWMEVEENELWMNGEEAWITVTGHKVIPCSISVKLVSLEVMKITYVTSAGVSLLIGYGKIRLIKVFKEFVHSRIFVFHS